MRRVSFVKNENLMHLNSTIFENYALNSLNISYQHIFSLLLQPSQRVSFENVNFFCSQNFLKFSLTPRKHLSALFFKISHKTLHKFVYLSILNSYLFSLFEISAQITVLLCYVYFLLLLNRLFFNAGFFYWRLSYSRKLLS